MGTESVQTEKIETSENILYLLHKKNNLLVTDTREIVLEKGMYKKLSISTLLL